MRTTPRLTAALRVFSAGEEAAAEAEAAAAGSQKWDAAAVRQKQAKKARER